MEDILASIRRIIADDQSRQSGAPPAALARAPAAGRPTATATPPTSDPATSRNARLPGLKPPTTPAARPALRPSADSLATTPTPRPSGFPHLNPPAMTPTFGFDRSVIDEIASVGVASALQASQQGQAPAVTLDPPVSTRDAGFAPVPAVPDAMVAEAVPQATPAPVIVAAPEPEAVAVAVVPLEVPEGPAQQDPAPVVTPPPAPAPEPEPAPAFPAPDMVGDPLVSPEAVATIESSFHALATTVFMQNTGMVEGLVRDMMRPMLKSWLDDNLPAIVERLVRIEIERVARGGRS